MQNASRLVLNLAEAAHRNDRWALTNALREIVENEKKKKGGGIAEQIRQADTPRRQGRAPPQGAGIPRRDRAAAADRRPHPRRRCPRGMRRAGPRAAKREPARCRGLAPRNRILLTGPPGNGKTSLAESIANALGRPFYVLSYDTLIGSHLGETGGRLRQVVDYIGSHECVVLLDEFESIAKERDDQDEVGEMKRDRRLAARPPRAPAGGDGRRRGDEPPPDARPRDLAPLPDPARARRPGPHGADQVPRAPVAGHAVATDRGRRHGNENRTRKLRGRGRVLRRHRPPGSSCTDKGTRNGCSMTDSPAG